MGRRIVGTRLKADISLLLITAMWGSSYLFSKHIFANGIDELTLIALRMFIAFILGLILFRKKLPKLNSEIIKKSFILGFVMFVTFALLLSGVNRTSAANAAFVNSLSVIIVPILSSILVKRFPKGNVIIGAAMAIIGVGLITLGNDLTIGIGEVLCIGSAFFEAIYILLTGRIVKDSDPILIAVFQIGFICIFSTIAAFIFESPTLPSSIDVWLSVLYLAVFCSALPLIVQTRAQQYTTPSHTAIILSTEPVFTTIFSTIVYKAMLPFRGVLGVVIVMVGVFNTIIGFKNIRGMVNSSEPVPEE